MADIIHRIGIHAPVSQVYQALTTVPGIAGWWTAETSGESRPGGRLSFRFTNPKGEHMATMVAEVLSLQAPEAARWRLVDGPPDWIGTEITFNLSHQDGQTILLFGHRAWKEASESMAHCSMKWATFLLSLNALVETGKGRPSPGDLKIDNWN
jgi:uncharacterized protein YndB with AHSA1/START domain